MTQAASHKPSLQAAPAERQASIRAAEPATTGSGSREWSRLATRGRGQEVIRRWEACTPVASCPRGDGGERRRARRPSFRLSRLPQPQVGALIAGFGRGSAEILDLPSRPDFRRLAGIIDGSSVSWQVLGFTDCTGSEGANRQLRLQRASAVAGALPTASTQGRLSVAAAPLADCPARDATEEGRRSNRGVALRVQAAPAEADPAPACPPPAGTTASSLADYLALVRCAERRTGFGPRAMLRLLRGLYFGRPWSVTARNPLFQRVILCSGEAEDPRPVLGTELFQALTASNVVDGVEMGHVFAGLEAMICPRPSVNLMPFTDLGRVAMDNESFATWGGDVGAAAGVATACWDLSPAGRMANRFCQVGAPMALPFYFRHHAESEDLEGDLDSFVLRARAMGLSCAPEARRRPLRLTRPISELLHDYYLRDDGPTGQTRADRYRCFVRMIGGRLSDDGRRLLNRGQLHRLHGPAIESFARTYYLNVRSHSAGGTSSIATSPRRTMPLQDARIRLFRFSAEALHLFFDWLDRRLQSAP